MDSKLLLLLVKVLLVSQIVLSQSNQDKANNEANEGALKIIGNLPRSGGDNEMNKEDLESPQENRDYWVGIVSFIVVPVIFVVLSMLLCPIWSLCRCCECCCCKKKKPKEEIKKCSIYAPFFIVVACLIVIVVMSAIAYGANVDFSGSLLHNQGGESGESSNSGNSTESNQENENNNLLSVIEDLTSDTSNKMNEIRNITIDIKDHVISGISDVKSILNNTSPLKQGANELVTTLNDIGLIWNDHNISSVAPNGETYTFQCGPCQEFSNKITNLSSLLQDQTSEAFGNLNNTVQTVEESLDETKNDTITQIDEFLSQITDFRDEAEKVETEVQDQRPNIKNYDNQRKLLYNILFVIPLFPIIFVLIGGVLKKSVCFTISYVLMWCSCTIMWLLLAIHLPITVLLNDSCNYLDVVDQNVTAVYDNEIGKIFQACLTDEKLVETLNLSQYLNFSGKLNFPDLSNLTDNFDFSPLAQIQTEINNTINDDTIFYQPGNDALSAIDDLCEASPTAQAGGYDDIDYDRNNIKDLTSQDYYDENSISSAEREAYENLEYLKNLVLVENTTISKFISTLNKIQANVTSVAGIAYELQNDTQTLVNQVDNAPALLAPLLYATNDLIDSAKCGFIGEAYFDTKTVLCSAVLGSLSRIVVSMFIIAILSLFSCLITIKLVRKVEWFQLQKEQDKQEKLQQSFQPNQPTILVMQPPGPGNNHMVNQGFHY